MLDAPPREREWVSWTMVGVWILLIYVTIPLARRIQYIVTETIGRAAFGWFVVGAVSLAVLLAIGHLHLRKERISRRPLLWLILVCGTFFFWTYELRGAPEESMHFVEYGVLGLLMFRAMTHRSRDSLVYVSAALAGGLVGTLDETIQWLTPGRLWDYRDLWINFSAGALAQLALWRGIRPPYIHGPAERLSVLRITSLASVQLVVLGLSLSNTPARVEWYAERIPGLQFLKSNESVMAEYGYKHIDPEIGVFYSRLTIKDLMSQDSGRFREAADALNAYSREPQAKEFLKIYTAAGDPFLHEARVHIYRRDKYRRVAPRHVDDPPLYTFHKNVAHRENQILEKHFRRTLESSVLWMDREYAEDLATYETDEKYVSPVSKHLLTRWSETDYWTGIAIALLVLLVVRIYYGRRLT
ncbi:MAG: VanZ family protein [Verrucomicrobia bacterium]|nr:VanZ family protein [Verrucomicrobiota bacterium]